MWHALSLADVMWSLLIMSHSTTADYHGCKTTVIQYLYLSDSSILPNQCYFIKINIISTGVMSLSRHQRVLFKMGAAYLMISVQDLFSVTAAGQFQLKFWHIWGKKITMPSHDGWMLTSSMLGPLAPCCLMQWLSQLSRCKKKQKSKRDHGGIFLVCQSKLHLFVLSHYK